MVGATEHELTKEKVPYEIGVARYREIARGQILGDDSGFFKMLFHRDDRRLLGVHIIGTGATELHPHRPGGARAGRRARLFPVDGLQLSDARRVLQGGGVERGEQAVDVSVVSPSPHYSFLRTTVIAADSHAHWH